MDEVVAVWTFGDLLFCDFAHFATLTRWKLPGGQAPPGRKNRDQERKNPDLAVLRAQMGPNRPNFKSYSHITALHPGGTVPGPFRPTFGFPAKSALA